MLIVYLIIVNFSGNKDLLEEYELMYNLKFAINYNFEIKCTHGVPLEESSLKMPTIRSMISSKSSF